MSAINWIGWVGLLVSVTTALVVSARNVSVQVARLIVLATQLQEKVSLCLVGIEALRMVDTDTGHQLRDLEQRVEDIERFLQLYTTATDRPFVIRHAKRSRPGK